MTHNKKCSSCGSLLVKHREREEYLYKDKQYEIDTLIFHCDKCGTEVIDIKGRDKQKKRVQLIADGLLTDQDIRNIRQKLGLTQHAMAHILGVGPKTFTRYENLSVRQSKCMDRLLKIIDKHPEVLAVLEEK
jgi:HTH-type transcriptional regulator / antitoxin MqsA